MIYTIFGELLLKTGKVLRAVIRRYMNLKEEWDVTCLSGTARSLAFLLPS